MNRRSAFRPRALSEGERKYVLAAAQGLTAQQTADRLGVTVNVVNEAYKRLKPVLGAKNITHLAVLALLNGDITEEEVRGPKC